MMMVVVVVTMRMVMMIRLHSSQSLGINYNCAHSQKVRGQLQSHREYEQGFKSLPRDFPGGPVGKTLCSQGRGPGFNPWSGN